MALFLGDFSQLLSIMSKEIPNLGLKPLDCAEMSWIQSVLEWANHDHKTTDPKILLNRVPEKVLFVKRKSDYVLKLIPKEGLELLWKKMADLGDIGMVFNSYGGKVAGVSDVETAFPHRTGVLFKIQYSISWSEEGSEAEKAYLHQARELHEFMTRFVSDNPRRAYLNYRDLDIGTTEHGPNRSSEARVYGTKYFNKNFDRLVKVKTMVDPDNFFRSSQSIPPLTLTRSRVDGAYSSYPGPGGWFASCSPPALGPCRCPTAGNGSPFVIVLSCQRTPTGVRHQTLQVVGKKLCAFHHILLAFASSLGLECHLWHRDRRLEASHGLVEHHHPHHHPEPARVQARSPHAGGLPELKERGAEVTGQHHTSPAHDSSERLGQYAGALNRNLLSGLLGPSHVRRSLPGNAVTEVSGILASDVTEADVQIVLTRADRRSHSHPEAATGVGGR
ncbi:unnamed protein product [Cuscuta campestris]|uniref:Berberine/berberine-like domain-containing protein n=1 Tax=Cuscuta campestris TaxID=132261 RepID=A0A484NA01_9ASTE|nr:unnamed protein product [Cuscuta campestris]